MNMNNRMWNRHKKALLDGVKNSTDSDMRSRFTELLVNMVEQEVMVATGEVDADTERPSITEAVMPMSGHLKMQEDFREITEAAMPMLEYLNKHYDPHASAVITEGRVTIIREEVGCPLPVRD